MVISLQLHILKSALQLFASDLLQINLYVEVPATNLSENLNVYIHVFTATLAYL